MVGAAPHHALAVDVHLTPLLLELGASVPRRGLYVLESELAEFEGRAREWATAT
jgi:FMN reductase